MGQADRQAAVGLAPDQAVVLQQADALAHRRAVDAELLDQFRFGADRFARTDGARENALLDCIGDCGLPGLRGLAWTMWA